MLGKCEKNHSVKDINSYKKRSPEYLKLWTLLSRGINVYTMTKKVLTVLNRRAVDLKSSN